MKEKLIATGKVKYVARDYPLPNHQHAFKASVATHCAREQGEEKFWEMSHKIFENYNKLSPEAFSGFAGQVGLDVGAFDTCLASGKYDDMINAKINEAKKAGIRSTPNFLVGYTQKGSTKFKAAELVKGAYPYANFEQIVNKLIKEQESGD